MDQDNVLLSPPQLAQRLDVSLRTVKRWTKEGTLPEPIRIKGNVLRYDYKEVLNHMRAGNGMTTEEDDEVENG